MVADGVIRRPAAGGEHGALLPERSENARAIQQREPDHPLRGRGRAVAGTTARIGHRHRQRADRALSASGDADRRSRAATGGDPRLSGRFRRRGRIEARTGGSRARHSFRHPARPPGRKRHGRGGGERSLRSTGSMKPRFDMVEVVPERLRLQARRWQRSCGANPRERGRAVYLRQTIEPSFARPGRRPEMDNPPQAHGCSSGQDTRAPRGASAKVWVDCAAMPRYRVRPPAPDEALAHGGGHGRRRPGRAGARVPRGGRAGSGWWSEGRRHLDLLGPGERERIPWPQPFQRPRRNPRTAARPGGLRAGDRGPDLLRASAPSLSTGFGLEAVRIVPRAVRVQASPRARARPGRRQAVQTLSLHGRPPELLHPFIQPGVRLLALSANSGTPGEVARMLCERGLRRKPADGAVSPGGREGGGCTRRPRSGIEPTTRWRI